MDYAKFGKFLKKRRNELHISQSSIAKELGYSTQIIYNWERGLSFPAMTCWESLMSILKIDINGLINCNITNKIKGYSFNENDFVFQLKDLRIRSNFTQIDVANKIGVNNKTVSNWEGGISLPSIDDFINLSKLYFISYPDLFYATKTSISESTNKKDNRFLKFGVILGAASLIVAAIPISIVLAKRNKQIVNVVNEIVVNEPNETTNEDEDENKEPEKITISLNKTFVELFVDGTYKIKATPSKENLEILWKSEDESIATINDGLITGYKYGVTTVTAYSKEDETIFASCEVKVIYDYSKIDSFAPVTEEALEYFQPSKNKVAKFYFEDKQTVIYTKQFKSDEPFSCDIGEPTFGPFKGYKYNFLGWDSNDDGVADPLPEKLEKDTSFVAVYDKEETDEVDFINIHYGKERIESCNKAYKTMILPSKSYFDSITPSDTYNQTTSLDNHLFDGVVENVIYMEGYTRLFWSHLLPNDYKFLSIPTTMTILNGPLPKVTINNGDIYGEFNYGAFANGINNKMITTHGISKFSKNAFQYCNELEYLNLKYDKGYRLKIEENAFAGCSSLKFINTNYDKNDPYNPYIDFVGNTLEGTSISYIDHRRFSGGPIKPLVSSAEVITILLSNISSSLYFSEDRYYNVLIGFSFQEVNISSVEEIYSMPNVTVYTYSETKKDFGWHFDQFGFPTAKY